MKIFIIKLDYSTEDCHDVELHAYHEYDKAYDKFKELICEERKPENSWVGNLDFDDDGEPVSEHYELDHKDNNTCESEVWWRVEDKWDGRYYVYIDLVVLEIE
ncbi:MAG: hypothetical protein ACI4M0_00570 [Christensenellales bacterium]